MDLCFIGQNSLFFISSYKILFIMCFLRGKTSKIIQNWVSFQTLVCSIDSYRCWRSFSHKVVVFNLLFWIQLVGLQSIFHAVWWGGRSLLTQLYLCTRDLLITVPAPTLLHELSLKKSNTGSTSKAKETKQTMTTLFKPDQHLKELLKVWLFLNSSGIFYETSSKNCSCHRT